MGTTRTVRHACFDYTRTRKVSQLVAGKLTDVDAPYIATALRGERIEVNDADLERGERLGALIDGDLPGPALLEPAAPLTPDVAGGSEPVIVAEVEGGQIGPVDPAVVAPPAPARPRTVAPVGAWREYAVARGMSAEEAGELSKDELIAKYPA